MKTRFLVFPFCLACCVAAPRSAAGERILLDGVVAKVNNEMITLGDVLSRVQALGRRWAGQYGADTLREKMRDAYMHELNALVERQVILDAYENQEGRIAEWAVERRINEIIHDMFQGNRGALMEALASDQLTYEEWKDDIRKQMIVTSMRQNVIQGRSLVSAAEVHETYRRNREAYFRPAEVRLQVIVMQKPADAESAAAVEALRTQLAAGADFAAAARAHSRGPRAEDGGDWGWLKTADLRAELQAAVEPLPVGGISAAVDLGDEIYLIKVAERRGGEVTPFEDVRSEIEDELKQAQAEGLYREWVDALMRDAYIEIYERNPFTE